MRAKTIELALHAKTKLMTAAIKANRSMKTELFDEDLDNIYTYIATGEKPKKE